MIDFNMTIKVTHIVYDTTGNEEQYLDMDLPTELVFDIDGDSDDIEFSDWYRFTTNEDDISEPSIEIVDNKVSITLSVQYYLTIDSND